MHSYFPTGKPSLPVGAYRKFFEQYQPKGVLKFIFQNMKKLLDVLFKKTPYGYSRR